VGACFYSYQFVIVGIVIFIIRLLFLSLYESRYQNHTLLEGLCCILNQISSGQAVLGVEFLANYLAYATAFDLLAPWARTLQLLAFGCSPSLV